MRRTRNTRTHTPRDVHAPPQDTTSQRGVHENEALCTSCLLVNKN